MMKLGQALMLGGLVFTGLMVATSRGFRLGRLNELDKPTDLYRALRSLHRPIVVVAYYGPNGFALRNALALRAPMHIGVLTLAVHATALANVPPGALRDGLGPEFAGMELETIALAINRHGVSRRWTTLGGDGSEALGQDAGAQADKIFAFAES